MDRRGKLDFSSWENVKLLDGLTLEEVANIIESNEEENDIRFADIYIAPPEPSDMTDEDSGDEDNGGLVDNLSGRQLRADAEVKVYRSGETKTSSLDTQVFEDYRNKKRKWIEGDLLYLTNNMFNNFQSQYKKYNKLSCVEIFELFLGNDIIDSIGNETQKYAIFLNEPDPKISTDEIKAFIAILLLSGYNSLPGKKCYWDTKPDMRNILVSEAMRRDRFTQIMRFIHLADNNVVDKTDKFFKVRMLINHLKSKFLENFIPHEHLSYDESMIKYYGRHGCKQFIRGKPIRFGYKAWCLTTDFGYLINFDFYQGRNPYRISAYESHVGKASAPLLTMLDELPRNYQNLPYNLFFDNLFTGFNLLAHLKQRGYFSTGTVRENRLPKDCPIPPNKEMKKRPRGSYQTILEKKDGIFIAKWMDNAIVAVASTAFGENPIANVKRYSQKEKKTITVKQPQVINQYNKHMGGVDRMDADIACYRIGVRGKKFWWPLFTWLIDAAVHNAWVTYKKSVGPISRLDFTRNIVQEYLTKYKTPIKSPGGVASRPSGRETGAAYSLRYDNIGHYVCETEGNKRRRCALETCSSQTRTMCIKCGCGLCVKCFVVYHKR